MPTSTTCSAFPGSRPTAGRRNTSTPATGCCTTTCRSRRLPSGCAPLRSPRPIAPSRPATCCGWGRSSSACANAPGHSPGSVVFEGQGVAFAGDVLFQGSIGRTDLPGGDFETLLKSIERELLTLPDSTIVYCGHGPETTVGRERRANPFLTGAHRLG